KIGTEVRDVLVPLRIAPEQAVSRTKTFTLLLLPGTTPRRITVSVARTHPDGTQSAPLVHREMRPPFRHVVEVVLDRPDKPGIYTLEVGAEPDSDLAEID